MILSLIPNHQKFWIFFSPNNTPWRQSIYFMKKDCTQANKFDWLNKGHELPNYKNAHNTSKISRRKRAPPA